MVEAEPNPRAQDEDDLEDDVPPGPPAPSRNPAPRGREPAPAPAEVAFDPFDPVPPPAQAPHDEVVPRPTPPVPVPVVPRHASVADRASELANVDADLPLGTPERPHRAFPSVTPDIVEGPTGVSAAASEQVRIDRPTRQSLNPRFKLQKP